MAQEERRMLRRSHLLDVAVDYRTATPTAPYLAARYHVHMDRGRGSFSDLSLRIPCIYNVLPRERDFRRQSLDRQQGLRQAANLIREPRQRCPMQQRQGWRNRRTDTSRTVWAWRRTSRWQWRPRSTSIRSSVATQTHSTLAKCMVIAS